MIDETIEKIEHRITDVRTLNTNQKRELLALLSSLKKELAELPSSDAEHAESIKRFTDVTTHEATRDAANPDLLQLAVTGMGQSVKGFETSHPQLVDVVNSIAVALSNLGI